MYTLFPVCPGILSTHQQSPGNPPESTSRGTMPVLSDGIASCCGGAAGITRSYCDPTNLFRQFKDCLILGHIPLPRAFSALSLTGNECGEYTASFPQSRQSRDGSGTARESYYPDLNDQKAPCAHPDRALCFSPILVERRNQSPGVFFTHALRAI